MRGKQPGRRGEPPATPLGLRSWFDVWRHWEFRPARIGRGLVVWSGLWALWLGVTWPAWRSPAPTPSGGRLWWAALEQYWAICYLLIYVAGKWRSPEPLLDRVMKVLAIWAGLPLAEGAVLALLAALKAYVPAFGILGWLWVQAFGPAAALYFLALHPFRPPSTAGKGAVPGRGGEEAAPHPR